jgi:hypothetical protein
VRPTPSPSRASTRSQTPGDTATHSTDPTGRTRVGASAFLHHIIQVRPPRRASAIPTTTAVGDSAKASGLAEVASPFAWIQQPTPHAADARSARVQPTTTRPVVSRAHPLARRRGARLRLALVEGGDQGASTRLRSCGCEGVALADRGASDGARLGKDAARAGGGGHVLTRCLRRGRSVSGRRDPPAAGRRLASHPDRGRGRSLHHQG